MLGMQAWQGRGRGSVLETTRFLAELILTGFRSRAASSSSWPGQNGGVGRTACLRPMTDRGM